MTLLSETSSSVGLHEKCYSSRGRRGRLIMNFPSYLRIGLLKEQGIELITCPFLCLFFFFRYANFIQKTHLWNNKPLGKWSCTICVLQPISMLLFCKPTENIFRLKQASSQLRSTSEIPSQSRSADCCIKVSRIKLSRLPSLHSRSYKLIVHLDVATQQ